MSDAMDIKESLGAHHVKAPTPPVGATKEDRLKEAQAHVAAANLPVLESARVGPGLTVRTYKDPQFGHMVEEHRIPTQAPGLGAAPAPAPVAAGPRGAVPTMVKRELAKNDDPGNTSLTGNLDVLHKPVPPAAKK
jgi:hypothetical protein